MPSTLTGEDRLTNIEGRLASIDARVGILDRQAADAIETASHALISASSAREALSGISATVTHLSSMLSDLSTAVRTHAASEDGRVSERREVERLNAEKHDRFLRTLTALIPLAVTIGTAAAWLISKFRH